MAARISRRELVRGAGVALSAGAAAGSLSGCVQAVRYLTQPDLPEQLDASFVDGGDPVLRLLNRASYGARPGELARARRAGFETFLEEQLRPGVLARPDPGPVGRLLNQRPEEAPVEVEETPAVTFRLGLLDTLGMDAADLMDVPKEQVQLELQQAAVLRAVYSRWQLREVMVEFWNDHFNVSQTKGDSPFYKTPYDAQAIRRHALGRFRHLLGATARSPAMLYYLDNASNRRGTANENYARELMELHTLGVHGGYTQQDVQEVARCFTGWTIKESFWAGTFQFQPDTHDTGDKVVLGRRIRGRSGPEGVREGEEVLDRLAAHPATARYVSSKLCRRFVADDPPESLVGEVSQAFSASSGHVAAALRVLFRSREFRGNAAVKMRRPFEFVIAALRGLNADTDGEGPLRHLGWMGQLPFHWAMPNGYPDHAEAWSASLLARWNFAVALVSGGVAGTTVDLAALTRAARAGHAGREMAALTGLLLGRRLPDPRRALLAELVKGSRGQQRLQQIAAALLASPDFQYR